MGNEISLPELKRIIRRRKKVFIVSFLLIFFISLIIAFVLPPIYKSDVTISVEGQEIPEEYVKSTITSYVSERLQILSNKILSYEKLIGIIKSNHLYPNLDSNGDMVRKMRKNIDLQTVDVSLNDGRSGGRGGQATIAFTLSFEHPNPEKAQKIANLLANLFVEEDKKSIERQAATTTDFLRKELDGLRSKLDKYEEKISKFKVANIHQLPGSTPIFSQTITRLEDDLDKINNQMQTNQDKIVYLKSQIANIDPLVPILTPNGKEASNPDNRLKYLRLQLIAMEANFSDKHPDVIRLKREIKELESKVGKQNNTAEKENQLIIVKKKLAELKSQFGDKYPDVIRLTREAKLLEQQIAAAPNTPTIDDEHTDNPAYMNIKAQIIVAQSEINSLKEDRAKTLKKIDEYQKRLEAMPFVEEEYNSLTLDYANAKKKYDEVSSKLHSAMVSQEMDTSNQGQRFHIDYPATLPDRPYKPRRLLIVLIGFVLAVGTGLVVAALNEGIDSSVKAPDELETLSGVPVLATVSLFDSPLQKRMRRTRRLMMMATVLVVVLMASLIINWFVMPMGDIWAKFQNRLVEIGVPIDKDNKKL